MYTPSNEGIRPKPKEALYSMKSRRTFDNFLSLVLNAFQRELSDIQNDLPQIVTTSRETTNGAERSFEALLAAYEVIAAILVNINK